MRVPSLKKIQPQPFMDESEEEFHYRLEQEKSSDSSSEDDTDPDAVSGKTVQREMAQRGWSFCIACQKIWLSWRTVQTRLEFGHEFIKMEITFWRRVRFTDKCHFSLSLRGKVNLLHQ